MKRGRVIARFAFLLCATLLMGYECFSQADGGNSWFKTVKPNRAFIQNMGQFYKDPMNRTEILFAVDHSNVKIYFTKKGIEYNFFKEVKKSEREREREEELEEAAKRNFKTEAEFKAFEAEEHKLKVEHETVKMLWENPNPDVEVIGLGVKNDYHSYNVTMPGGTLKNINFIKGFEKILYKNIYPGIDVEYTFAEKDGLKYSVIVHPGADVSLFKMNYDKDLRIALSGNLIVDTKLGDMLDHAPLTFYENDNNKIINSKFKTKGRSAFFELDTYDPLQTVIIDPWTQAPNFVSNWDCVWECEKDGAGNVYIIGGVNKMQLLKYNSGGALQWTYNTPYDTTAWLGTFATDNSGNSYVTQGSTAQMIKVNTAGGLVWNNTSPSSMISAEFWNITFNCDQTRLVVGGTGGSIPPLPYIYQIDVNTGNVVSSLQVTPANLFPTQEVRSICASGNGKYYFLTHDTVGYINQNFSICGPNTSAIKKANNSYALSYKCENYRYNNSGIMAIRSSGQFFYTHRGNQIDKRSLTTLAVVATAAIPGGAFSGSAVQNSGIDIDACGNVYVGSKNQVIKFDANLNQLATYATSSPFNVYDVHVSTGGDIIACGSTGTSATAARTGYIQSIAASACAVISFTCCDPSICIPPKKCITDPNFSLTVSTAGGTWSGTGVNASGVFSPSLAGVGTHTVVYTLACGSESVLITVSSCSLYICQTNGSLTVSGGTGPYIWSSISTSLNCSACPFSTCNFLCAGTQVPIWTATGSPVSPPAATVFPIKVKDANGTTYTIVSMASVPNCTNTCPTLTVSVVSQTNVNCFGANTGTATMNVAGGAGPYTYTWTPGNMNGASQSALTAGTYTVNVKDANGCVGSGTVTITQPTSALSVSVVGTTTATCIQNGTGTVSAFGGTPGYTYTWSPSGGNSSSASNLAPGNYTVSVTDSKGCTANTVVTISQNTTTPNISASVGGSLTCNNSSVVITGTSTTTGATYTWQPGNINTPTLSANAVGNYSLTVTNPANGCTSTTVVSVTQNTAIPNISASVAGSLTCANTSVIITGASTVVGATFTWQPGNITTATLAASSVGNYSLTVKDPLTGCINTTVVAVSQNTVVPNISATVGGTLTCTNTSVVLTGSSTVAGATFTWQPGNIVSPTMAAVAAGNYSLTVKDPLNGCINTTVVTVMQNTVVPNVSASVGGTLTCSTISVVLTGTSTTSGVTFSWQPNNVNTSTASATSAGNYTLTVTNPLNGCVNSTIVSVSQNTVAPNISASVSGSLTCAITTVALTGTSTTSGATYTWQPSSANTPSLSVSSAGNYTLTVTNPANGCTSSTVVTVLQSAGIPTISASVSNSLNCVNLTATLNAVSAGNTIVWNGGALVNSPNPAAVSSPGSYTATATNTVSGCTSSTIITVIQNTVAPSISAAVGGTLTCTNLAVVITGTSTSNVTYTWQPGNINTSTISASVAGNYSLNITSIFNGCISNTVVAVTQNTSVPNVSASVGGTLTCANLSVTLSGTSTTSGVTYTWMPGNINTASISTNVAGNYTLNVTNPANGCVNNTVVSVTQNTVVPNVSANVTGTITCLIPTVVINGNSSTAGATFTWMPGNITTSSITVISTGNYTLFVSDPLNGCINSTVVTVTQNGAFPNINVVTPGTLTCLNTTVALIGSSSTAGVNYSWTPQNVNTTTAVASSVGSYTFSVFDPSNGCKSFSIVSVTQMVNTPTAIVNKSNDINCSTTSATLNALGAGNTYVWNGGSLVNSPNPAVVISAGNYTVTITDAISGCVSNSVITVNQSSTTPVAVAIKSGDIDCHNSSVTLTGSSTSANVNFQWINGPATQTYIVSSAGIYTFSVTDPNTGCTVYTTIVVNTIPMFNTGLSVLSAVNCFGAHDGVIQLINAGGGQAPFTITNVNTSTITNTNSFPVSLNGLSAGNYTFTVSDANGCLLTHTINLTEPPKLNVIVNGTSDICEGQPATLNSLASGGSPSYNYSWTPGGMNSSTIAVTPASSAQFTLVVIDSRGCVTSTIAVVNVHPKPVADLTKQDLVGCAPVCNTFSLAQTQIPGYNYNWWFYSSGSISSQTVMGVYSPTVCFGPGVYNVSVSITSPYNCSATRSYSNYITVFSKPVANFIFTPDKPCTEQPEVKFYDQSSGANTYNWYNVNDLFSQDKNASYYYFDPGKFLVTLVVSNQHCSDTISKYVVFEDEMFYIPNTFTPNDDGLNEYFRPKMIGYVEDGFHFMIFDRWGKLLFKTDDPNDMGWNGHYKGEVCKDDVYVWKIDVGFRSGKKKHLTGHVTLLK